ncbi:MAG: HAMP domain-containing histidine kinase [Gemmatimonadota bacterium]|nr:HAMP domain-containing histidine kinase [Gemmatimonadota bacterium]
MAERGGRRTTPLLVVLLLATLAALSAGAGWVALRHFRGDSLAMGRLYAGVFAGLNDPQPSGAVDALLKLGEQIRRAGIPLVVTDTAGLVTAAANLPFSASLDDPRVLAFASELDRQNPPIVEPGVGTLHFGPVPAERKLIALGVLQALIVVVIFAVGFSSYRSALAGERDRLWVAMAREAAHQMGTPLMSLQGWIEQLRSRAMPPPAIADHLTDDAERLTRVAQRFERIGHPIRREPIDLRAMAAAVAEYFQPRLPRRANSIRLGVEPGEDSPIVRGDPILLEWALESLVRNAIDALQGREGTITLRVGREPAAATVRVVDDGPGIPSDLRRQVFAPGVTTKSGGWGIGLALARRVVEDSHGGELVLESPERGASFLLRIPMDTA